MNVERQSLPSASNWARYESCPGSFQLSLEARRLGQEAFKRTVEADSGERIHAVLAGDTTVKLSEAEEEKCGFLRERADGEIKRIFGDEPTKQLVEERFWFSIDGQAAASGRVDRVVYSETVALVQDYKSGFREPEPAETNAQLKFLAVVTAMHLRRHTHVEEVVAQIISGPYGVTETRFTKPQLADAWDNIIATLKAINDPRAAFNPSPQACRYCPAMNICQAVKDLVLPVAKQQCSSLPSGDRAARLLDECELLERHITAIRAHYTQAIAADPTYEIPGWSLEPGPSRREVKDWRAARDILEEFIDPIVLGELASFSIPSVEKLLAKTLGLKGKEAGVKLAQILGELLNVRPGNLCLKRVKGEARVATLVE